MWLPVSLWLAWPWHTCEHQRIIIRDWFSSTLYTYPRECRLSHTLGSILSIPFKQIHSNSYYIGLQISFEYSHLLNIPSLDQLQRRPEVYLRELDKQNKTTKIPDRIHVLSHETHRLRARVASFGCEEAVSSKSVPPALAAFWSPDSKVISHSCIWGSSCFASLVWEFQVIH